MNDICGDETIDYIIKKYTKLAEKGYKNKNDRVKTYTKNYANYSGSNISINEVKTNQKLLYIQITIN